MFTSELEQRYFEELEMRLQPNIFEAVLNTHPHLTRQREAGLRSRFDDETFRPPYPDIGAFAEEMYADLIEAVATAPKSIVFVSLVPYFQQVKIGIALQRLGYRPFFVSLQPVIDDVKRMIVSHFGKAYNAGGSYHLLRELLGRLKPDVAYAQCWMWHYRIGRLVLDHCPAGKTVCDFYDITSIYAAPEIMQRAFPREDIDLDLYLERYILDYADVVISRFPDFVNRHWARSHEVEREILHFNAYPVADHTRLKPVGPPMKPCRLVYAGGLVPSNLPAELFPESAMWNAFEVIARQGFDVEVLHDPHRVLVHDRTVYEPYQALAARQPNFRMRNGVSPDRLPEMLQQYDFGILTADFSKAPTEISWFQRSGVFATKLLSYLEAGLPIIVNAEYTAMAKFVAEHNVGIAVATHELPALADILNAVDYQAMQVAIRKFVARNNMAVKIHDLLDILEDAA